MMRYLSSLALIVTLLFGGSSVKIASYNVENLFDLHYDGSEYLEYIPDTSWQWNRTNYTKKLHNIAQVVADINADVIALQEIESLHALRDLKQAIKQAGCYYPHMAIASKKNTTVKVALLSKLPITSTREITVSASRKYRSILEAKLDMQGMPLYLFVNHWKSKSGPESKRVTSAKALRQRLEALGHKNPIILLGDFNSHHAEYETFIKKRKHNDTGGITGINHILKTLHGEKAVTLNDLKTCAMCYYNLWYELPEKQRWSHRYRQYKESLDHIIISPGLHDNRGIEYTEGSFSRFTPDYLFHKRSIYRWQRSKKYPKHHTGQGYSDHLPIYATFHILKK